ncbi:MAG: hypothetical protein AUJ98_11185 [Bacteroidetes bacterium CG2_30_33_31]|nr:MAG: hypothetical protein AUJ98_11185 [Bacteroidetes bacterium CG2_30_33_31]
MKKFIILLALVTTYYLGIGQSVTTNAASMVSYTTATLNGTFTDCNGGWLFNAGFDYGLTIGYGSNIGSTPGASNVNGSTCYSNISGLTAGTTYHVQFKAMAGGPYYLGGDITFTTASYTTPTVTTGTAANIAQTSFDVNINNVSSDGGATITEQGVYYSSVNNPPTNADSKINSPTGVGNYDVSLTGLTAGTTYYVRAFAINSIGTGYGSVISQLTNSPSVPTVSIGSTLPDAITSITTTTANCNGNNATLDGGATITDKGICWNTGGSPTISDFTYSTGTSGTGSFNANMGSLSAGTTYYVRAYATNSAGPGYSSTERVFITNTNTPTAAAASNIDATTFYANWNATTGAQSYRLDVATDATFTSMVSGFDNRSIANVTTEQVFGLSANTAYYYRVRAYHDGGADGASFTSASSSYQTVTTLVSAPTTSASNLKYETIGNDMNITWTNGDGSGRLVTMKAGAVSDPPVGGTTYTGNAAFGSGDQIGATGTYIVYSGNAKGSVLVTGLTPGTIYYFDVVEYNGTGSSTNYKGGAGAASGFTDHSALPIELVDFSANSNPNGIELNWTTATEINNNYFEIQRSIDGIEFTDVARVNGAGNSNIILNYNFLDNNVSNGIVYYRLKQIDFNGKANLSKMIFVNADGNNSLDIIKVISENNQLDIYLNKANDQSSVISVYNSNGQLINESISNKKGSQVVRMNMSGNASGIYFINVEDGINKISKKILL